MTAVGAPRPAGDEPAAAPNRHSAFGTQRSETSKSAKAEGRDPYSPDFLADCRLMLRFALKEAYDIPPDLRRDIAALDLRLVQADLRPISSVSPRFSELDAAHAKLAETDRIPPGPMQDAEHSQGKATAAATAGSGGTKANGEATQTPLSSTELLLKIHSALAKIVAPATPLSLVVSEPPPGRRRWLLSGTPLVVKLAAFAALFFAVGFVVSTAMIVARQADQAAKAAKSAASVAAPGAAGGAPQ